MMLIVFCHSIIPTSKSIVSLLSAVSYVVRLGNTMIHSSKVYELKNRESNGEMWLDQELPLCGDIKMEFYHNPRFGRKVGICKHELSSGAKPFYCS